MSFIEEAVARVPEIRAEAAQKAREAAEVAAANAAEDRRLATLRRHERKWEFQKSAASRFQKMTGKGTGPKRWTVVEDRGRPREGRIVLEGLEFRIWNGLSYLDVRWADSGGRWFSLRSSHSGPVADRLVEFLAQDGGKQ